jgi:hypothetical protein
MAVDVTQLGRDGDLRGLVRVLEDASADVATKVNAARALWMFAAASDDDRVAVVVVGAIPALVELLSGGLDKGRAMAAGTLGNLAFDNTNIAAAVMAAGAIPPACGAVERQLGRGQGESRGRAGEPRSQ